METVNNPRLLVIGGNGFIGRKLSEQAGRLGWAVTCLSLHEPDAIEKDNNLGYIVADISDRQELRKKLNTLEFEYIVNLGGYIDHKLFFNGGRSLIKTHFEGVQNLVETLNRDRLKAFVQIGSSDEYGNAPAPQSENFRERPISPYSVGKTASTHFLQMLYRTEQFPAVILRLFLTYGPGQKPDRFIPQLIKGCIENRKFPASEGMQIRDFCYIDDTVNAIIMALQNGTIHGEILNVGSGIPISIKKVIKLVQELVGKGEPDFGAIPYRKGENMELYAKINKITEKIGWKPEIDLLKGLGNTISWMKRTPH